MKKYLITLLLFTALCRIGTGQDLYDKISDKMCKCLEKENAVDSVGGNKCFKKILFKFSDELVKYHKLNSIEDLDMEEYSNMMWGRLAKNCKFLINVLKDSILKYNPQFVPDVKPICDSIHTGEFYYVEYNPQTDQNDTTFATFTNEQYTEKMQSPGTYSRLSIKWVSACHFKLTFIESDDPLKKSYSKPGDVYDYEIRKVTANSFIVEFIWDGPKVFIEYIGVK